MLIPKPENYKFYEFRRVGDKVVELKQIVAYSFIIENDHNKSRNDALDMLINWMQSDKGKWVLKNSFEGTYFDHIKHIDPKYFNYVTKYIVVATFEEHRLAEYYLRFGK